MTTILSLALPGLVALATARSSSAQALIEFAPSAAARPQQVAYTLSAEGVLRVKSSDGKRREVPLKVLGKLDFTNAAANSAEDASAKWVRHYQVAQAEIEVDGAVDRIELSPNRRWIVAVEGSDNLSLYSPHGPLTREDVELLQTQFDPAWLGGLLPRTPTAVGQAWSPPAHAIGPLLGLDAVGESDLECVAVEADADWVRIRVRGTVRGAALGAKATIEMDGHLEADRARGRVGKLAVDIKENREIGHFAPGFDLFARLEMDIRPASPAHAGEVEKRPDLADAAASTAIDFASPAAGLGLVHDRRWRMITHTRDLLVMRLIERGEVLAQCNISPLVLDSTDPGAQMARFRQQVQAAVGRYAGRLDEASQAKTDQGLEILRISASGNADSVPITWIYYLIAQNDGRQAAVAFTLETRNLARFRTADHDLVGGMRFLPR